MMEYEWGPWIEHDGKGCPVVGEYVHRVFDLEFNILEGQNVEKSNHHIGIVKPAENLSWSGVTSWLGFKVPQIIRYRVRKPRVSEWLRDVTADIKEGVDA